MNVLFIHLKDRIRKRRPIFESMNKRLSPTPIKKLPLREDIKYLTPHDALSLSARCNHRLNKKFSELNSQEISFLEYTTARISNKKYTFTQKQLSWLISILERTSTHSGTKL